MRKRGYGVRGFGDDWVVVCKREGEGGGGVGEGRMIVEWVGVRVEGDKRKMREMKWGFEFVG